MYAGFVEDRVQAVEVAAELAVDPCIGVVGRPRYYFIDDEALAASPDLVAYLLHDAWPLPTDVAEPDAVFSHGVPVRPVRLAPPGPESVFSVRLSWESEGTGRNLDLAGAIAFPGLTLPALAARLCSADETTAQRWPRDARLLRALVAPADDDIGTALQRYARLPGYDPTPAGLDRIPALDAIHQEPLRQLLAQPHGESLVHLDPHIAQVSRYIDSFFGHDQWFLFDSRWAVAHPDLARSLLRFAAHWDPYEA